MGEATIGEQAMSFYLNPTGFDKTTSVIPCVPFIMKVVEDDDKKKSLMRSEAEVKDVEFKLISSFDRTWPIMYSWPGPTATASHV